MRLPPAPDDDALLAFALDVDKGLDEQRVLGARLHRFDVDRRQRAALLRAVAASPVRDQFFDVKLRRTVADHVGGK
jgi:hypothetical protein